MKIDLTKDPISKEEIDNKLNEIDHSIKEKNNEINKNKKALKGNGIGICITLLASLFILPSFYYSAVFGSLLMTKIGIQQYLKNVSLSVIMITGLFIVVCQLIVASVEVSVLIQIVAFFSIMTLINFYRNKINKYSHKISTLELKKVSLTEIPKNVCLEVEKYIENPVISNYHKKVVLDKKRKFIQAEVLAMKSFMSKEEMRKKKEKNQKEAEESYNRLYIQSLV